VKSLLYIEEGRQFLLAKRAGDRNVILQPDADFSVNKKMGAAISLTENIPVSKLKMQKERKLFNCWRGRETEPFFLLALSRHAMPPKAKGSFAGHRRRNKEKAREKQIVARRHVSGIARRCPARHLERHY
jgi:hypothetical protein